MDQAQLSLRTTVLTTARTAHREWAAEPGTEVTVNDGQADLYLAGQWVSAKVVGKKYARIWVNRNNAVPA
ncbi:MAG TPA: hypothetical protein VFU07_04940 [Candidatus Lumbricidophila sp.]|nr:hypothetical protein [Candidatus Lumbricidophila sp.]